MEFRSSNTRFVHFGGDVVSNVESSHGVQLTGGSTGARVIPAGDDANIKLELFGKGTGNTQLGNSSATALIGNSTTAISALQRYAVQFTPPALAASVAAESTYTVTGLTTNASIIGLTARAAYSTQYVVHSPRCSTADELVVVWMNKNASTIGTGESTNRWTLGVIAY